MLKSKKLLGFTVVEMLVVMTIIAVLLGISLVSYEGARKAARDSKRKADLESIRSALEVYRTDCRTYPENDVFDLPDSISLTGPAGNPNCNGITYIEVVPEDPIPDDYYSYIYSTANKYFLCAHLETLGDVAVAGCGDCGDGTCNYMVTSP